MTNRVLYLVRHGEHDGGALTEAGERQARLTGQRLRDVPFAAIHHSPSGRAVQTAKLIAESLAGVPLHPSELLRECVPAMPARSLLSPEQREFFDSMPADRLASGPAQAAAAVERYAGMAVERYAGVAGGRYAAVAGERYAGMAGGRCELVVSHGNLINWFVCRALDAPDHAWLRMLDYHCAITVIMYFPDRVKLVSYNDVGHLPAQLRGTGYPGEARI